MKTIILIAAVLCCTQISASVTPVKKLSFVAETKSFVPAFSFVRGHKQGRNHVVTWGMTNNTGISHFIVQCTYEDPYDPYSVWQSVGVLPCTKSPIFKFTDSPYLPGTLTYRIIAVMSNNSSITSWFYIININ